MRVLLSTIGSRGDVQPMVALGLQLKALGQEARLCVPPDFEQWVASFGLAVTPIGPEVRKFSVASVPSTPPSPEQVRQMMDATAATQFETISAAARDCDAIVAATAIQMAARSVAERMRIPYIFAAYCPRVFPSPLHAPLPLPSRGDAPPPPADDFDELWARNAQRFNDTFRDPLNSRRTALGLAPVEDVRSHMFTDRPWLAADATLGPWPDPGDERVFQSGAWILPDDRVLSSELNAFLDAGDPPVYFGFGSARAPQDLSDVMTYAARALGRRAIVSRGWADLSVAGNDPDCLVIGETNVPALFSRVAAVVHHGGAGTTTAAALAGAPQVIVPQLYDQHYWAERVQHLGIGSAHAAAAPTRDSLTAALGRTLQPEVAARARAVAPLVRRDGARAAAERLIAGEHEARLQRSRA